MAKARKCDRCGTYYDDSIEFRKYLVLSLNPEKRLDLCIKCYKDLENFLGVKEETNDNL